MGGSQRREMIPPPISSHPKAPRFKKLEPPDLNVVLRPVLFGLLKCF